MKKKQINILSLVWIIPLTIIFTIVTTLMIYPYFHSSIELVLYEKYYNDNYFFANYEAGHAIKYNCSVPASEYCMEVGANIAYDGDSLGNTTINTKCKLLARLYDNEVGKAFAYTCRG